jgi:hypothetical protein
LKGWAPRVRKRIPVASRETVVDVGASGWTTDDLLAEVVEVELDLVEEEPTDSSPVNCTAAR